MAGKILKDMTTYVATDKFKYFRETLVSEIQENFEIIEKQLGYISSSLDDINGEVV